MKSEMEHRLELLTVTSKINACLEMRTRIQAYLNELYEQERTLHAEGEEYDKAKDAELEAARDEDIDIPF